MGIFLGIDAGTVSFKWVLTGPVERLEELSSLSEGLIDDVSSGPGGTGIAWSRYSRVQGTPLETARRSLAGMLAILGEDDILSAAVTGASSSLVSEVLGIARESGFRAVSAGAAFLHPGIENILEMGGENSSYIKLSDNGGYPGIISYETNGDCAAGTGSFLDQQASRLRYRVEDIGTVSMRAERSPRIAGRCSVFAKSDMIHAQQKGYRPEEILKGLCEAVARNFKSTITRGRSIEGRCLFVGGVAMNEGVVSAMREVFGLAPDGLVVPERCAWTGALGAALLAADSGRTLDLSALTAGLTVENGGGRSSLSSWKQLEAGKVTFLRDSIEEWSPGGRSLPVDAWLGIDIGSVSTNLALIDDDGRVIRDIYLKTEARPIEAVSRGLSMLEEAVGEIVRIRGAGTTGSGRELIGELTGADTVNDEITAHKTGALFIGGTLLGRSVDTIFEIGGQDSKYIRIDEGVVVDFAMNEACAAGTGSFLEEQAEKLNVDIIGEFSGRALASAEPVRLGERCTVYMEHDVTACMKRGAGRDDLIAGLAYSVVQNYLNRVVRGRRIGDTIFFQGGTAYNDSVAAAFSRILGREIIVPPYNGVIGAIGAALLAREKVTLTGRPTTFRGYDISSIDYSIREFTCSGCSNLCDIHEFRVGGERTYWGDKCSDRYRRRKRLPMQADIPDMTRLYVDLLERDYTGEAAVSAGVDPGGDSGGRPKAGIPRAMSYFDSYPFWSTYLELLGFEVVASPTTARPIINSGIEETVAEPCAPVQTAHGHVAALLSAGVDLIFVPNTIDASSSDDEQGSYICPWGQTLPFVLKGMPSLRGREHLVYCPTLRFRGGEKKVEEGLWKYLRSRFGHGRGRTAGLPEDFRLPGRRRHRKIVRAAYLAQGLFESALKKAGEDALEAVEAAGSNAIVITGRPYNIFDSGMNLDIPSKLRDYYGVNVIPAPFLPVDGISVEDIAENMFWDYGNTILRAARFTATRERFHLVYLTNFKCGPDSYIKHFCVPAAERPFLALQFDAHGNDAGMLTRCEAFLESKGVLSWWKREKVPSVTRRSISPGCPQAVLKHSRRRSGTWG